MLHAGSIPFAGFVPRGSPPTLDALGSALKYWWEVDDTHVTLNGSNVSQLDERVAGTADAVQATPGNQPAYTVGGGPNGLDCLTLQDSARRMIAAISVAAANRHGIYLVSKVPTSGWKVPALVTTGTGTNFYVGTNSGGAAGYYLSAAFTTTPQIITTTSPALDAGWHLHALRPLATGALYQIDGVTVTPDVTGTDTLRQFVQFYVGEAGGLCGGDFWAAFIVDDSGDANDQILKDYVEYYTAIPMV